MLNLGFFELMLFAIIALIVLGPEQLIVAARVLGKWYGKLRRISARLQSEFVNELQLSEIHNELKAEIAQVRASEHELKSQLHELQRTLHNHTERTASSIFEQNASKVSPVDTNNTTPLTNRFFLLGEYDKARRLPRPPFLPNYRADRLLFQY